MTIDAHPRSEAAQLAVEIYRRTLEAVRADRLVAQFVSVDGDRLTIQDRSYDLGIYNRILVVAIGKAAVPMARQMEDLLGNRISGGLVVTKQGHGEPLSRLEVIEASHPVPDDTSLQAGQRVLGLAETCTSEDLVLFLLSGGASALVEVPVEGVSLEDLQRTNSLLLASGADIVLMNAIRSHASRLKAGGLARAFGDATVVGIVLSDVIGNSIATIGSGPLVAPRSDVAIPDHVLDALPESVRREVLAGVLFPKAVPTIPHFVIGSVSVAIHAAADISRRLGVEALPYSDPLAGEAREMARRIANLAERQIKARGGEPFCMVFGGETTVTIRGKGLGGRAQEMALAAATTVARYPRLAFLAAGTDGTDGPTDAAGGLVEVDSIALARAAGFEGRRALVNNDSYRFLAACNGLIKTGPTGSNVNDLCLVVHLPS